VRDERQFGAHAAWIEEPDIFVMRLVGKLDGPDLQAILEWYQVWQEGRPECFVLVDVSRLTMVSQSAREVSNSRRRKSGYAAVTACFGASFSIRVLADMVMRARRFLGNAPGAMTQFFATEAEARAYFAQNRRTPLDS
jgi:hypothetical protein